MSFQAEPTLKYISFQKNKMSEISIYTSANKIKFEDNKNFIFTFDVIGSTHRDFNLKFKVSDENIVNEFLISNNLNNSYAVKSGISHFSAVKKKISNTSRDNNFFNDTILINKKEIYKQFSGEHPSEIKGFCYKDKKLYVKTDLYTIENEYIVRKNPQLKENLYLRPVLVEKTYRKNLRKNTQTEYFDTLQNPINSNENKTYRIIVSDGGRLISFLIKEGTSFKIIKNFTYPTDKISEGLITLELDNNMKLSDLHFSFFKA